MNTISVIINNELALEYELPKRLPGVQRRFLEQMDADMDQGINLNDENINSPSQNERNQYVVMHLIDAIEKNSENLIQAMCAYLGKRSPSLNRIDVTINDQEYRYTLGFDSDNQQA